MRKHGTAKPLKFLTKQQISAGVKSEHVRKLEKPLDEWTFGIAKKKRKKRKKTMIVNYRDRA